MELMDATWRPLFLLYNNGSCFLSLSADEDKTLILNLERTLFIRHQNGCLTKNCY